MFQVIRLELDSKTFIKTVLSYQLSNTNVRLPSTAGSEWTIHQETYFVTEAQRNFQVQITKKSV